MANHAYASVWCKGFSEAAMLGLFEQFLKTVPFSEELPGFTSLVIRAVEPSQVPVVERDLRARPLDAAALVGMAREHLHADSAYEAQAHWDLWVYDSGLARWQRRPQRLEITCFGEEYDDGVYAEAGHFQVDAGFEHLFTGHAGLLGFYGQAVAPPQHPTEAEFLSAMASPENLREYHERTRENIRKLLDWMRQVQSALPIERYSLWSEGEENFEARVDEILALR